MRVDREWIARTLAHLVQIDSVNPTLAPGGGGEKAISEYLVNLFETWPVHVDTFEPEPGRVSVLATLRGTGGGRSLMLNAHVDTVGVEGMAEPFSGAIREGRLYGRGAYDMKGSLAACLGAVKALCDQSIRPRGDVMIAAVADEEYGSLGTADLITRVKPDAAIVTEPTAGRVCLAHKGYLWITVKTHGRAAHGSRFELGIDANMRMGRFLAQLDRLEQELRRRTPHALVGPPSLHAALLKGGEGLSTYAPVCELQIERRTIPGETEQKAVAEVQSIVDRLSAEDQSFCATVECFFSREPFEVAREAAIVQHLVSAVHSEANKQPNYMGDTPWMDAALLSAEGVETVVYGPAGAGAHAIEEWVELESVYEVSSVLARTAADFCA